MAGQPGLVEFGWTFVFQIVNTIIIFLVLKKLLFKPVRDFMMQRKAAIEKDINEAEAINTAAKEFKYEYEEKLGAIKEEGREIIKESKVKAEEKGKELIKEAQDKAAATMKHADEEIQRQHVKAMNELKDEVAAIALMTAEKILEEKIDEKSHDAMIKKFIDEVGEAQWQN